MNPFKYGQIVKANDFCQRPELEENLAKLIKRGQNVCTQGERRTGKTSLICETVRKLKKRMLVYIDLLETKTSDDCLERIVTGVMSIVQPAGVLNRVFEKLAYLRPVASIDPISGIPTLALDASVIVQASSAQAALKRLLDLKILFHQEEEYRFVNPFFRTWLLYKKL